MKKTWRGVTETERFWKNVSITDGCWEWTGAKNKPPFEYGKFTLHKLAHRHSWEVAYGEIPNGMLVLHRCDNPSCVRPSHLFLGSQSDNMRDMFAKGREYKGPRPHGEEKPMAKLTEESIELAKKIRAADGRGYKALGTLFGVSGPTIWKAMKGKTWKPTGVGRGAIRENVAKQTQRGLE